MLTRRIIFLLIYFFLFSFKINFLSVGEGGVRIDDLLMLPLFLGTLCWTIKKNLPVPHMYFSYLIFIAYSVVVLIWSSANGRVEFIYGFLFILRLLQYSLFLFVGMYLARCRFDVSRLFKSYILMLLVVVPLQMSSYLPVPGEFGSFRASGNTNGPYELAVLISFIMFYFLDGSGRNVKYAFLSFLILLATASRITLFVTLLILFVKYLKSKRGGIFLRFSTVIFVLSIIPVLYVVSETSTNNVQYADRNIFERYKSVDLISLADAADEFYKNTSVYKDSKSYIDGAYLDALSSISSSQDTLDPSGLVRFSRWASLLKSLFQNSSTIFFGLGPSFGSIAVDGYYIRLLVETGFFGFLLFIWFLYNVYSFFKRKFFPTYLLHMLLVLTATGFFIDIFMSYKPMMLFWLLVGIEYYRKKNVMP